MVNESTRIAGYGFIGAGEITAAIVEGLSADNADPPAVFLSPRGRDVGRELAGRFPNVRICNSNQDVLDNVGPVVLAVRPPIVRTVLAELSFQPRHAVISAVAGIRLQQLREWTAPAGQVVRVIPLPHAARRHSLTAMYPNDTTARELFGRVGDVVAANDEKTLNSFSAATATFAAHLDYLTTIADWLTKHGVDDGTANAYTTYIFGQLGQSLLDHHDDSLAALTKKYMTPGGINEQLMTELRDDGVPDLVRQALDRVLTRLSD